MITPGADRPIHSKTTATFSSVEVNIRIASSSSRAELERPRITECRDDGLGGWVCIQARMYPWQLIMRLSSTENRL